MNKQYMKRDRDLEIMKTAVDSEVRRAGRLNDGISADRIDVAVGYAPVARGGCD